MKPTVTKLKDVRGRITGYRAALGPVERDAKTPAEAIQACETATLDALRRFDRDPEIRERWGHLYGIAPTLYGYAYWIDTSGTRRHFQGTYATIEDCNAHALNHLGQNVWTHETDDATFCAGLPEQIKADLENWIRFQRAYARLEKEDPSLNANELHRRACEASYVR